VKLPASGEKVGGVVAREARRPHAAGLTAFGGVPGATDRQVT
jgi:hypothetical protein